MDRTSHYKCEKHYFVILKILFKQINSRSYAQSAGTYWWLWLVMGWFLGIACQDFHLLLVIYLLQLGTYAQLPYEHLSGEGMLSDDLGIEEYKTQNLSTVSAKIHFKVNSAYCLLVGSQRASDFRGNYKSTELWALFRMSQSQFLRQMWNNCVGFLRSNWFITAIASNEMLPANGQRNILQVTGLIWAFSSYFVKALSSEIDVGSLESFQVGRKTQ